MEDALTHIEGLSFPQRYGAIVQIDNAKGAIVFETEGGSVYIGQLLVVQRGPSPVATARVTRRFTGQGLATAGIIDEIPDISGAEVGDIMVVIDE